MNLFRRSLLLLGFTCIVGALVLFLQPAPEPIEVEPDEDRSQFESVSVEAAGPMITQHTYQFPEATKPALYLYEMDPSTVDLELEVDPTGPSIAEWRLGDDLLLVNGFYFTETMEPSGNLWDEGTPIGGQAYDPDRSVVVRLAPKPAILDTSVVSLFELQMKEGGQTFPLLLQHGEPTVQEDSGRLARRTFIGFDQEGQLYIGIVPNHNLSLYALSQLLPTTDINWEIVANLDGGPSTGIQIPAGISVNSYTPIPNIIRVRPKAEVAPAS